MPYLRNMLAELASDLHDHNQMHVPVAVGLGRGDMRPWEFDELAQIFREMFPGALSLSCMAVPSYGGR